MFFVHKGSGCIREAFLGSGATTENAPSLTSILLQRVSLKQLFPGLRGQGVPWILKGQLNDMEGNRLVERKYHKGKNISPSNY